VCLFVKTGPRIDWLAFKKHPFDGIDGIPAGFLYNAVKPAYNGAVKMTSKEIFAVLRECEPRGFSGFNTACMGGADQLNASASREVETLT